MRKNERPDVFGKQASYSLSSGRNSKAMTLMGKNKRKMSVLIVDDNEEESELLNTIVKALGQAPWISRCCSEALDEINERPFDLILLDAFLLDEFGYEMIPFIKNRYPDTNIVVMSRSNYRELEAKVRQIGGINFYMLKPYTQKEIKAVIDHITWRRIVRR